MERSHSIMHSVPSLPDQSSSNYMDMEIIIGLCYVPHYFILIGGIAFNAGKMPIDFSLM